MIKVGIDATTLLVRQKTGVERYTERLLTNLVALGSEARDVELFVYLHTGNPHIDLALRESYQPLLAAIRVREHRFSRGYNVFLPYKCGLDRLDLLHLPGPYAPRANSCPLLITCHDVAWVRLPPEGVEIEGRKSLNIAERAIKRSIAIIADSISTKQDIVRYYGKQDNQVEVVYLGVDDHFVPHPDAKKTIAAKYGFEPYMLNVAAIQYRKNQVRLLEAFAQLVRDKNIPHTLVIAGRDGWGSEDVYAECDRLNIQQHVCFLGYVPEDDLPLLYSAADLVVYPSIYEGFGLPVLEAMACGAVLAVANASSLPEVGGEAVLYFDPFDVNDIASCVLTGLSDGALRKRLQMKGIARAREFSWETTAKRTLEVYRKIGHRSQHSAYG